MANEHFFNFNSLQVQEQVPLDSSIWIRKGGFWNYIDGGKQYVSYPGGSVFINLGIPVNTFRWIVICLDDQANPITIYCDPNILPMTDLSLPIFPNNRLILALLYIDYTTVNISSENIYDLRQYYKIYGIDNTTIQKIMIYVNSEFTSRQKRINFIDNEDIIYNITNTGDISFVTNINSLSHNSIASPSDFVETEKTYNRSFSVGIDNNSFSREDHTHGSPVNQLPDHLSTLNHSVNHSSINDPSPNEKQALNSLVAPSTNNPYLTNSDPRLESNILILSNPGVSLATYKIITNALEPADSTILDHKYLVLGMNLDNINPDSSSIRVQLHGYISNPEWTWDIESPIYLDSDGNLIQTVPMSSAFVFIAGIPISSTEIILTLTNSIEAAVPPEILSVNFGGSTNNPTIYVQFNVPIDPDTITTSNLNFKFLGNGS